MSTVSNKKRKLEFDEGGRKKSIELQHLVLQPHDVASAQVRVYCDGVFDLFHYGHARALKQAKELLPNAWLVVGVCNDHVARKQKGKTIMNLSERVESVKHCRYVDEIIENAPWEVDQKFLDDYKIDYVVHGSEECIDANGRDIYGFAKQLNKYKEVKYTSEISTSQIILRIVRDYDSFVRLNIENETFSRQDMNVSLLREKRIIIKEKLNQLKERVKSGGSKIRNISYLFSFMRRFGEKILDPGKVWGLVRRISFGRQLLRRSHTVPGIEDESVSLQAKSQAFNICKEHLAGWNDITMDKFEIIEIKGGMTNKLYKCHAPDHSPECALVRIFGSETDKFFDREKENAIFKFFADINFGPKLLGVCDEARIEEFILSKTLATGQELSNIHVSGKIARNLAIMHSIDMPFVKVPSLFESLTSWLGHAKEAANYILQIEDKDKPTRAKLLQEIDLDRLDDELLLLHSLLDSTPSPIVFCHNDLLVGNILLVAKEGQTLETMSNEDADIRFIDFEYGSYNFRGYDFGNHFCEWTYTYGTPEYPHFKSYPDIYPDNERKKKFFREYLKYYRQLSQEQDDDNGQSPRNDNNEKFLDFDNEDKMLEQMCTETDRFALAAHFMWGLWGIIQTQSVLSSNLANGHNNNDATMSDVVDSSNNGNNESAESQFGYLEFGTDRFKQYFALKQRINLTISSN